MKDGTTKQGLKAENAKLRAQLAKYERGDTLRKAGEHWYELDEYFDAEQIRRIPAPKGWGTVHLMGMLQDIFVVEIPATAPAAEVQAFANLLRAQFGQEILLVTQGVRFLRLRSVDAEMEEKLDRSTRAQEQAIAGDSGDDPGTRPELQGDGLGSHGPEGGGVHRGGSGDHRAAEEGGTEAPDGS